MDAQDVVQMSQPNYSDKACLVCGKTYTPTSGIQKYCPDCGPVMERGKHVVASRKSRALHPETMIEFTATHKEQKSKWRRENLDKGRMYENERRALKYGNTSIADLLTEAQWRDILDTYHHRCAYCGKKSERLTIDHVIPVSHGGTHSVNNVVPACQHCNDVKGTKTPERWVGMKVTNG